MYKFLYKLKASDTFLVISSLITVALGLTFLVKLGYIFATGENLQMPLPIEIYCIFLAGLLLICIVDGVIYFGTVYVTEDESAVEYFISKHVAPKCSVDDTPIEALMFPNLYIAGWFTVCWLILELFSFLWFIIGAVLTIYGILEILRRGWKVQRKLQIHINETDNAHSNKENNNA